MLHVLLCTINDVQCTFSHVLLQDDGLTEQSNLKHSEVSSLGCMWSGDELIVSVVCSTCKSPRQHKTTPAAQFIHKHVHVQTIK